MLLQELVPGYRAITQQYFAAMEQLGFRVLRLLALSLALDGDHFLPFFTRPMLFLRPLHYRWGCAHDGPGNHTIQSDAHVPACN